MMELLFLVFVSLLFGAGAVLIWKCFVHRNRAYILMFFNLLFLISVFYMYPLVAQMGEPL